MADNAKIVLRWEIDDPSAVVAAGKVESEAFSAGGFQWTASLNQRVTRTNNWADFTLKCGAKHSGPFKCEVHVEKRFLNRHGRFYLCPKKDPFRFDDSNCYLHHQAMVIWPDLAKNTYSVNGKAVFEFHIEIISSAIGQSFANPAMFDAPSRMSNVILKIEEKKLYVSKEILAVQSPVFETLFFGDFAESRQDEVEIQDVVYEEFLDLLHLINLGTMEITDRTVMHILKLADQFQMERVLDQTQIYLTNAKGFDVVKKLLIADQYRLCSLRDHCLKSFSSYAQLAEILKSSPDHDKFSDEMMAAIFTRSMKI